MSTKTSIKRIALVAVAALGFGMVSTVSANAAYITADVTSINLKEASVNTDVVGTTVAVNVGAVIPSASRTVGNQLQLQAALTAYPSGGFVAVSGALGPNGEAANTNATYPTGWAGTAVAGSGTGKLELVASATTAGSTVTATSTTGFGSFTFAPTKAGTYTLTVWHDTTSSPDAVLGATEVRQTINIVVTAAAGYSASLSSVYLGTGATYATSTTDLLPVAASKATGTQAANVRVAIKDTLGSAYTGQTVTASVAGPGLIYAASVAAASTSYTTAGSVRAISVTDTTGYVAVSVWPDGTSGTSTVTISVTDQFSGLTTVLGTKTITFYGSVAKLTATANYTILKAGGGVTGGSVTGTTATDYLDLKNRVNATDIPAVIIKATDSSGNVVGGLTIKGLSSDTTVANSWTAVNNNNDATEGCSEDVLSAANVYSSGGTGYYNCALSTPSTAVSGGKATITFRLLDPSDPDGLRYLTVDVPVTVGKTTVAKETLSFDKASYAPGEAMVITRTAVDSAGNPVADGTAAPAVTFSKAVGGTAPAASTYVGGKKVTSTTAPSVFAPVTPGDFIARMTSGNAAADVVTASATVADDNATAAIDAANEATDAANAATDAANAAAEAADAATAAAQDAQAAVAALADQVASTIASLKAQLNALSAVLLKISKKVKA